MSTLRTQTTGLLLALTLLAPAAGCGPQPEPTTPGTSPTPTPATATPTATVGQTPTEPGGTPTATEPGGTPTTPDETPTEPGATPTEPGATPTEPGATPTEPGATPTEPGATPTQPGTPIPQRDPLPGELVVTEMLVSPRQATESAGEWLELLNTTADQTFDISTLVFSFLNLGSDTPRTYTLTTLGAVDVGPGERVVIAASGDLAENGGIQADAIGQFFMTARGFTLEVQRADTTILDTVPFDPATWPELEGHALSLDPSASDGASNDDAGNWCASFSAIAGNTDFGTPGDENEVCGADLDADRHHGAADCDDSDPNINTSAGEDPINLEDDDCDGDVDEAQTFADGALLITEFLYNPTGEESNKEWFEVLNTTEAPIDLIGFAFNDSANTHIITDSVVVPAGEYVVLGSSTDTALNGGAPVAYAIPDLALNNGPSDLIRLSYENLTVDAVFYDQTNGWLSFEGASYGLDPRHQHPFENDDPGNWCVATSSWTDVPEGDKGSPGEDNDTCPIDSDGDGYLPGDDCDDDDEEVYPSQIEIPGNDTDDDCDGVVDEVVPASKSVVITEIMYDSNPPADSDGEWFELHNLTGEAIDLAGWKLEDNNSNHTIVGPLSLPANGYLVLGKKTDTVANGGTPVAYSYGTSMSLGNDGDIVRLTNSGAEVVDTVEYGTITSTGWPSRSAGYSIQLSSHAYHTAINDEPVYWCLSSALYGTTDPQSHGTPGAENRDCRPGAED